MDHAHCTGQERALSNEHEGPVSCPLPTAPNLSRLAVAALEPGRFVFFYLPVDFD
jgi:hypothetical protein